LTFISHNLSLHRHKAEARSYRCDILRAST
jgi:hypothetical protein